MVTATLNNYRQSPRKVRLVVSLVKGRSVAEALALLAFVPKRASRPLATLINSAVANAKHNFSLESDSLFVKDFRVDAGKVLKRSMPRARGSAFPIKKRTSHITLVLANQSEMKKSKIKRKNDILKLINGKKNEKK